MRYKVRIIIQDGDDGQKKELNSEIDIVGAQAEDFVVHRMIEDEARGRVELEDEEVIRTILVTEIAEEEGDEQ